MGEELVYLIQRGHEFKIGHTTNLKKRLMSLSVASAVKLRVVHTVTTTFSIDLEDYLKRLFIANRLRGEWYALNDASVQRIMAIDRWPIIGDDGLPISVPARGQVEQHVTIRQGAISFDYLPVPTSPTMPRRPRHMKAEHPLSRWRKVHGLTQQSLATATGLTQGMIAHIENYRHIPVRESLERLRVYTGLPTDALVRGEQFLTEQPDFPYSQHEPNPT